MGEVRGEKRRVDGESSRGEGIRGGEVSRKEMRASTL